MSYQALYRKYRPSTLEDVIGQDVVVQILKNAIKNNKVGHAYMFSGPRGIGKTSIAKLLAKAINCLDTKDGDSCEKCENCISINTSFNPDIIEIDAASNNGVDEIREIRNSINLVPNQLKYKIYIIDEVHMLSIGAFNALLKTLEEPPEHVIFILATTDLHKVPSTIISRCQCFEFNRISIESIVKRLSYICKKEKINVDNIVLNEIAELSDGGLRDAVGMLDKLNAYSNGKITIEDFEKVNGIVSSQQKKDFINYVYTNNVVETINFLDSIYSNGKNLIIFIQDLLKIVKNQCIDFYVNNGSYDISFLLSFSMLLNELLKNIKTATNVKLIVEITILSFMNDNFNGIKNEAENISQEIINTSSKNLTIDNNKTDVFFDNTIDYSKYNKQIINNCFARASKKEKSFFESNWNKLNDYALDSTYGAVACYISDGNICAVGEGEVIISFEYESMVNRGIDLIDKLEELLKKIYDKHYDIALITQEQWNNERNEFIKNKNDGVVYNYIPIDFNKDTKIKTSKSDTSITSQAIELFGQDMISLN